MSRVEMKESEYLEIKKQIATLQGKLDGVNVVKDQWFHGKDKLDFVATFEDKLVVHCNYDSWKYCLYNNVSDPMYLEVEESGLEIAAVSLNLEQMEELRDYLTQKIDYLKGGSKK